MGVLVARLTGARDPRTVGSGRTGGTNALRAMGFRRAIAVAALDVVKGALPVLAAVLVGASPLGVALIGVAAVLGAWASIFLRFHGGRGVATAIGATLAIATAGHPGRGAVLLRHDPPDALRVAWLVARRSVGGADHLRIRGAGWNDPADLAFAGLGAGIVWIAHHDNIGRLMRGEERRFDFFTREP